MKDQSGQDTHSKARLSLMYGPPESCNGLRTTERFSRRLTSLVHNRGRSRGRGRNPNAGATQRRRTNLGRAGSGWPLFLRLLGSRDKLRD